MRWVVPALAESRTGIEFLSVKGRKVGLKLGLAVRKGMVVGWGYESLSMEDNFGSNMLGLADGLPVRGVSGNGSPLVWLEGCRISRNKLQFKLRGNGFSPITAVGNWFLLVAVARNYYE